MTLSLCDQVAERVALGESLGELTEHTATCSSCQRLVAMSSKLGATHHAVDPGLGFSARMTVGAQHRLAVRRRQRLAAGLAATVAGGVFGVFLVTRSPEDGGGPAVALPSVENPGPDSDDNREPPEAATDEDLASLVEMADVRRAGRVSARWSKIERPLAPYKKLLKGETP